MRAIRRSMLAFLFTATLSQQPSAQTRAPSLSEADRAAIQQMFVRWERALNASDASGIEALFTADAVTVPGDRAPSIGRNAGIAELRQILAQLKPSGSKILDPEIEVTGDWSQVRARFQTTWTALQGGKQERENSRYIWVLRRQPDRSWKIARFVFYPLP